MRQACVQFDCISNNDEPLQQCQAFYIQALTKGTSICLSFIAA
jgi:hypothetical protein